MKNLKKKLDDFKGVIMPDTTLAYFMNLFVTKVDKDKTPNNAMGEFAELISALSDYEGRPNKEKEIYDVLDEMADAKLLLMALQDYYGVDKILLNRVCTLKILAGFPRLMEYMGEDAPVEMLTYDQHEMMEKLKAEKEAKKG